MKFPEPKDFHGAISPSTRASWICGIGIFEYPIGRPRPVLSLCWSIAHLIVYLLFCCFSQIPRMATKNGSLTIHYMVYITNSCCLILAIASMIGARKTKASLPYQLIGRLGMVGIFDRRISSANRTLNRFSIAEDYGETFNNQILVLVVGFLLFIAGMTISCTVLGVTNHLKNLHFVSFCITAVYRCMFILVSGCTYSSYFWYIDNRLQHLNAYLLKLTSGRWDARRSHKDFDYPMSMLSPVTREFHGDLRFVKAENQQWMVHLLRDARRVHYDLCITAKEINRAFGIQIYFVVTISFLSITSIFFSLYEIYTVVIPTHNTSLSKFIIPVFWWLLVHFMTLYYVVSCSLKVSRQARKTGEIIHELVTPNMSSDVHAEIAIFSLQLIQNPLELTANGLFTLDYVMIRSLAGSVTTYFVIMIQMRNTYGTAATVETTNMTTSLGNSTIF